MMCYLKKRKKKNGRKKESNSNHNLAYKQLLTVQSYVAWQNATMGGCKAQSKPRKSSIACQ